MNVNSNDYLFEKYIHQLFNNTFRLSINLMNHQDYENLNFMVRGSSESIPSEEIHHSRDHQL